MSDNLDELRNISELTEDELNELAKEYENREYKVKDLLNRYRIKGILPSHLLRFLPNIPTVEECPYCGSKMYRKPSRSDSCLRKECFCIECGHTHNFRKDFFLSCNCNSCIRAREVIEKEEELKRQEKISLFLALYKANNEMRLVKLSSLSLIEKLFVSALCQPEIIRFIDESGTFQFNNLKPLSFIFPNSLRDELLQSLVKKLIYVNSDIMPSDCYVEDNNVYVKEEKKSFRFAIKEFNNESSLNDNVKLMRECLYLDLTAQEVIDVWKKISYSECVDNLVYQISPLNDLYIVSETVKQSIEKLLEKYPPSRICSLFFSVCSGTNLDYCKGIITKDHAANRAIYFLNYRADKYYNEGMDLKPSRRDYSLPQSSVSFLFFKKLLKLEDDGFNSVIDYDYVRTMFSSSIDSKEDE